MAVTSDAMYSTGTAGSSFIPSNVYCGCVLHRRNGNQLNTAFEHVEIPKPPVFGYCSYDTAMETDDGGLDYSTTPVCSINESVILEASLQNRLQGNNRLLRSEEQAAEERDTFLRTNRKRCNSGIIPTSWPKKFRKGRRGFIIVSLQYFHATDEYESVNSLLMETLNKTASSSQFIFV